MMTSKQQGFTIVELVVVIVVLGILAAIAIPRYANYVTEARSAAISGMGGAVRSSVVVVQGRWTATGANSTGVTMQDGTNVAVSSTTGIPLSTAGGIDNAVNLGGTGATFVYTPGAATGTFNLPTTVANCNVVYTAATGTATVDTSGC